MDCLADRNFLDNRIQGLYQSFHIAACRGEYRDCFHIPQQPRGVHAQEHFSAITVRVLLDRDLDPMLRPAVIVKNTGRFIFVAIMILPGGRKVECISACAGLFGRNVHIDLKSMHVHKNTSLFRMLVSVFF